jgi:hypothetical protein
MGIGKYFCRLTRHNFLQLTYYSAVFLDILLTFCELNKGVAN